MINDRKAVVDLGSVGQPRESDDRAGLVIVEGKEVNLIGVSYTFKTAMREIEEYP